MAIQPNLLDAPADLLERKPSTRTEEAQEIDLTQWIETTDAFDDDVDDRTLFQRYRVAVALVIVMLLAVGLAIKMASGTGAGPRKESAMVIVSLPPPPPPPPPQQAPPEPKMVEQQTFEPEEKPQEEPPQPPDQPPLGTNIKGDGRADGFGLSGSGNGFGNGGTGGTRFGWYAGQVQSKMEEALRNNRKTRSAEMTVQVRIWPDATGRVTRSQLTGSTGDPSLDSALQSEVLANLQLREPPPPEMPMPIVLRLTARRSK